MPDFAGVLGGAALGFAGGVSLARGPRLRAPAFAGAAIGGGYGLMVGSLLPTLDETGLARGAQDRRRVAGWGCRWARPAARCWRGTRAPAAGRWRW